MEDYNAASTQVRSFQRCYRLVVELPRPGSGSISFMEQLVTIGPGGASAKNVPGCDLAYDANQRIAMRNPITGALTGETKTQAELYALLLSAYRVAADQRDRGK